MYRVAIVLACVAAAGLASARHSGGDEKAAKQHRMERKLEYSSKILGGLVNEDFQAILKNAKALNRMGEQNWLENQSPEYRTQNQVFWFTSGALIMAAESENIDAATLSYTQMTLSCVQCHKLIRGQ